MPVNPGRTKQLRDGLALWRQWALEPVELETIADLELVLKELEREIAETFEGEAP